MRKKYIIIIILFIIITVLSIYLSFNKRENIEKKTPRLVLIYAPCTVNKNYLSTYNSNVLFTPNLKQFSKKSCVFFNHRTNAGLSGVAYASLFSGNFSPRTGVFSHPKKLADKILEIFEIFKKNGYETFYWNKHPMASSDLNYAQGVNRVFNKKLLLSDDPFFNTILEKLKTDKNFRALIVANFTVTHSPYLKKHLRKFYKLFPGECNILQKIGKEKFDSLTSVFRKNHHIFSYNFSGALKKFKIQDYEIDNFVDSVELLYKSNIFYLDKIFGEVLDNIKKYNLYNDSLIVFTADHGELLYRKNYPFKWSHGFNLTNDVLNIPLVIKQAGPVSKKSIIKKITRSVDVLPTILSLSGLKIPKDIVDGKNIFNDIDKSEEFDAFSFSGKLPKPYLKKIGNLEFRKLRSFFPSDNIKYIWVALMKKNRVLKLKRDAKGGLFYTLSDGRGIKELKLKNDEINYSQLKKMRDKLMRYKTEIIKQSKWWSQLRNRKKLLIEERKKMKKLKSLGYL